MTKAAPRELVVGDRIGEYRVVGLLAGGGYRAVHVDNAQRVQIEVAPLDGWRDAAVRMLRAARMIESLQHPGIGRIVARGVLPDRRPWMATEVPSGLGLYDLIARRQMPAAEVAALVHDLADVLAHAHERGVVHRAFTLRSIVLATGTRGFSLCVADWGLAVADLGVYSAPEGATGDGRVDVYALGVIAYRAATRRFPLSPVTDVPGVPVGLATLVARMLATEPVERPTAAEVRALADELLETVGVDPVAAAVADAELAAAEPPELVRFADDDVVYVTSPRFGQPKWTPAPPLAPITSDSGPVVVGEIIPKR